MHPWKGLSWPERQDHWSQAAGVRIQQSPNITASGFQDLRFAGCRAEGWELEQQPERKKDEWAREDRPGSSAKYGHKVTAQEAREVTVGGPGPDRACKEL